MKAIVQTAYGDPDDVLELREVERPAVRDHEVLVRVHAASLHPDVWHAVRGVPYVLRLMGGGLRTPKNPVPGIDLAGRVEAIGPGVTRFEPGDEVFGETVQGNQWRNGGAYAEYAAVREAALAPKPANLTLVQAAAVPTSALIAHRSLLGEGSLKAGQKVLVNGAGGGVGAFAVQIAKAYGAARVTAVDGPEKAEMLRSIGADEFIDYTRDDFTSGGERYDLILDIPGNRSWSEIRTALTPEGRYVLVGHDRFDASTRRWIGSIGTVAKLLVRSPFDRRIPGVRSFKDPDEDPLATVAGFVEAGKIAPVVDSTYRLSEIHEAIHRMESGQVLGKVVITV
jgi:NADPH:quinone reductase-like Zn-dependent oxidoreductase